MMKIEKSFLSYKGDVGRMKNTGLMIQLLFPATLNRSNKLNMETIRMMTNFLKLTWHFYLEKSPNYHFTTEN